MAGRIEPTVWRASALTGRLSKAAVLTLLLACVAVAPASAEPKAAANAPATSTSPSQSAPAAELQPEYRVRGFRSALFGMTRPQVVNAIRKDFQLRPADIHVLANSADGTVALVAKVGTLDPGPGKATVTYILGKNSRSLIHVNVVWLVHGAVISTQRDIAAAAGRKLADYFSRHRWIPGTEFADVPVGDNSVVLFVGKDAAGRAVEVRADGVDYVRLEEDGTKASPPAKGALRLRVAYSADADRPDIGRIGAGGF